MTRAKCGMTVMWDCECDPELNALIAEGLARDEAERRPAQTGEGATQ